MKKLFTIAALLFCAFHSQAQSVWADSVTVRSRVTATASMAVKLYIRMPQNTGVIQGIILVSGSGIGKAIAADTAVNRAADAANLAIVLVTGADTGIVTGSNPAFGQPDSLKQALTRLAVKTARPELANAPLIIIGHGKGAGLAKEAAYESPLRVAGIISYHPSSVAGDPVWANTPPYQTAVNNLKMVPHLVINGETEGPDVNNNLGAFTDTTVRLQVLGRRANNELVQHVVEMNGSFNSWIPPVASYVGLFIRKTAALRIPAGSNATSAPVTLNVLPESGGYLGKSAANHNFKASNYTVGAYAAVTPAASALWFYDSETATAWKNLHTSPFTIAVNPPAYQVIPYCSGTILTGLQTNFTAMPGVRFNPDNFFRVEVSSARGDFYNYTYPARNCAAKLSNSLNDSMLFYFPDNLQAGQPVAAGSALRYRIRVLSSSPWMQSVSTGEIKFVEICNPGYDLYLDALPGGKFELEPGEKFRVKAYLKTGVTLNAANHLKLQLSDTLADFTTPTEIGDTAATFVGNPPFIWLSGQIPAMLPVSSYYYVRVVATDPSITGSSTGQALTIRVRPSRTAISEKAVARNADFKVFPNPGNGLCSLKLENKVAGDAQISVSDLSGKSVYQTSANFTAGAVAVNLTDLKQGVYIVTAKTAAGTYMAKYIKN